MSNPIKDIPYEELKEYCNELGYNLVKKPDRLVPLKRCPECGRKPGYKFFDGGNVISYICPNGCFAGTPAVIAERTDQPAILKRVRTQHEACQLARENWNDAVERWQNENKTKTEK